MGKTRPPERSKLDIRKRKLLADKKRKPSPKELLAQALQFLQQSDAEQALTLATSALKQLKESISKDEDIINCLPAINLLGEINVELGDIDSARQYFNQAIQIDEDGDIPEEQGGGPGKFLWLAQLSEEGGNDSVTWYTKAADVIRFQIDQLVDDVSNADHSVDIELKKQQLANTLCAITEVYMTDLSWEDDAEANCDQLTEEALTIAPNHSETLQTVASVRISQSKPEEARKFLRKSIGNWKDLPPLHSKIPDFPVRISLVRLLLEAKMESEAVPIAERLILEDDHSVEAWYLGGWCLYLLSEEKKDDEKLDFMKRSRGWLLQCQKLYESLEYEDDRLYEHSDEIIETLNKVLGPPDEDAIQNPDEDEDDWQSNDESDDEDMMEE